MLGMMRQALARWRTLDSGAPAPAAYERDPRYPDLYPANGLVLKQTMRDLPRPIDHPVPQARPEAVNFDYVWFTQDEARLFLPPRLRAGERVQLAWPIVRRL